MIDANQRWDVAEAISWVSSLAEFKPLWIEEPTSPDDILGHAAISKVRGKFFQPVHMFVCWRRIYAFCPSLVVLIFLVMVHLILCSFLTQCVHFTYASSYMSCRPYWPFFVSSYSFGIL